MKICQNSQNQLQQIDILENQEDSQIQTNAKKMGNTVLKPADEVEANQHQQYESESPMHESDYEVLDRQQSLDEKQNRPAAEGLQARHVPGSTFDRNYYKQSGTPMGNLNRGAGPSAQTFDGRKASDFSDASHRVPPNRGAAGMMPYQPRNTIVDKQGARALHVKQEQIFSREGFNDEDEDDDDEPLATFTSQREHSLQNGSGSPPGQQQTLYKPMTMQHKFIQKPQTQGKSFVQQSGTGADLRPVNPNLVKSSIGPTGPRGAFADQTKSQTGQNVNQLKVMPERRHEQLPSKFVGNPNKQVKKKEKADPFAHLIMSNQKQQKSNQNKVKIQAKNYIPIQNIFATSDRESRQIVKQSYYKNLCDQTVQEHVAPNARTLQKKAKIIQVFVESNIEFQIEVYDDPFYTCGWLQSEVARKYYEVLEKQAYEQQKEASQEQKQPESQNLKFIHNFRRNTREQRMSTISQHVKLKKKFIVALKTLDMRESLDFYLTQYNRPLSVLENGEFLRAHFAKLTFTQDASKPQQLKATRHDFEQIKVIGRGAFSRVVLVRKKDTGRLYAMKIMRKDKLAREQKIKPVINERTIMERINHPFITKLYWSFQSRQELFFVMDLCTGGEMFFHLGKVQKFTEQQAKFYFAELLLGFEYLHEQEIVYRDIKPENILIDIDGHVKIADFGLSKIIPKRQRSYSFCGSPEYMCPEILMGQGHDRRADIYCAGALLYELVIGFPPHFNQDHKEIYKGILNQEPEYKEHNLSDQLKNLLQRMLQKDPERRFQSFTDVRMHPWLSDIDWNRVIRKDYKPPIVPGPHECCIDEEFLNLPLDFEDSSVPVLTERRQSCYYESTLMLKTIISDKNTIINSKLQQLYNNLNDTRNMSLLLNESARENRRDQNQSILQEEITSKPIEEGLLNPTSRASDTKQPQDSYNRASVPPTTPTPLGSEPRNNDMGNAIEDETADCGPAIDGLTNFSFADLPQEEVELRVHFNKFIEQMQINELVLQKKQQTSGHPGAASQMVTGDSMNVTNSVAAEHGDESRSGRASAFVARQKQKPFFDDLGFREDFGRTAQAADQQVCNDEELRQFELIEEAINNESQAGPRRVAPPPRNSELDEDFRTQQQMFHQKQSVDSSSPMMHQQRIVSGKYESKSQVMMPGAFSKSSQHMVQPSTPGVGDHQQPSVMGKKLISKTKGSSQLSGSISTGGGNNSQLNIIVAITPSSPPESRHIKAAGKAPLAQKGKLSSGDLGLANRVGLPSGSRQYEQPSHDRGINSKTSSSSTLINSKQRLPVSTQGLSMQKKSLIAPMTSGSKRPAQKKKPTLQSPNPIPVEHQALFPHTTAHGKTTAAKERELKMGYDDNDSMGRLSRQMYSVSTPQNPVPAQGISMGLPKGAPHGGEAVKSPMSIYKKMNTAMTKTKGGYNKNKSLSSNDGVVSKGASKEIGPGGAGGSSSSMSAFGQNAGSWALQTSGSSGTKMREAYNVTTKQTKPSSGVPPPISLQLGMRGVNDKDAGQFSSFGSYCVTTRSNHKKTLKLGGQSSGASTGSAGGTATGMGLNLSAVNNKSGHLQLHQKYHSNMSNSSRR